MASSAKYEPVSTVSAGSGGSSTSSNDVHLTPDGDSDDELPLEELEKGEGYEMREIVRSSKDAAPKDALGGADQDNQDSEDEEDDDLVGATQRRRRRRESTQSFELYTPDEERSVRRKLDRRLVLFVAFLYMLSFLDRSNIGNARIAGLVGDLQLSDGQYDWLLTAFYITYILFEWMAIMFKLVPAHIYLAIVVCAWGLLASLQSLSTSFSTLLVLRALLGIGEAAFTGIPFYLSFFFKRDELAFRTGIFIAAAPLATTFASSLAWAIVHLGDRTGVASWRLLFLVEGFPSVLVAVWVWFWIPDSPSTARWLTARERKVATIRLRKETPSSALSEKGRAPAKERFKWREVLKTLQDPKSYLTAGMFFSCNVAFSSMPVFLPTIINDMGYSTSAAQALSAPPFLVAFFVVLITAWVSDKVKSRSVPMMAMGFLAMSGYLVLALAGLLQLGNTLRYLCIFPICAGFFSCVTIVISWTVNNQQSDEGKGAGVALLQTIGQLGPLVGTRLYPESDAPYYVTGMSVCAGFMALVGVLAFALRVVLKRANARVRQDGRGGGGADAVPLVDSGGYVRAEQVFVYML